MRILPAQPRPSASRSNTAWSQLTTDMRAHDTETVQTVRRNVAAYYAGGLPSPPPPSGDRRVSIIFSDAVPDDIFRALGLADALHTEGGYCIQLVVCRIGTPVASWPTDSGFDTIEVDEQTFPAFAERIQQTAEYVTGDVVYCIGPGPFTLGLGLMCNARDGTPIVLDDTACGPHADCATTSSLASIDPLDPGLRSPSTPAWASIMAEAASRLPHVVTASDALSRHYGDRTFRIRQALDKAALEPKASDWGRQERAIVLICPPHTIGAASGPVGPVSRAAYGATLHVRLWPHAYDAPCPTLDPPAHIVTIEPGDCHAPSDLVRIADLVRMADLVVVWMDPDAAPRVPVEFIAAIALKTPVISTPLGDLATLGWLGHLQLVDFGDTQALQHEVGRLLAHPEQATQAVEAAHNLYLRQFSSRACARDFGFVYRAALAAPGPLSVSTAFRSLLRGMRPTSL